MYMSVLAILHRRRLNITRDGMRTTNLTSISKWLLRCANNQELDQKLLKKLKTLGKDIRG